MFELHPQLEADTFFVANLELCRLLLMNDANYPWLILVPRVPDVREIYQLSDADQRLLLKESSQLSSALMALFKGDKLNVAALGNMVPQLHIHHIVRYSDDPSWPKPVWGQSPPVPYQADKLEDLLVSLRSLINGGHDNG